MRLTSTTASMARRAAAMPRPRKGTLATMPCKEFRVWTKIRNSTEHTCLPMIVLRRALEWALISGRDRENGDGGLLMNLDEIDEDVHDGLGYAVVERHGVPLKYRRKSPLTRGIMVLGRTTAIVLVKLVIDTVRFLRPEAISW